MIMINVKDAIIYCLKTTQLKTLSNIILVIKVEALTLFFKTDHDCEIIGDHQ